MASAPLDTLSGEDGDGPGARIARLEATVEAIIRSLDSLQRSVEGLRADMQSLELRVRQSLDASRQNFRLEAKLDRIETKLDRLDEKLDNIAASLRAEMRWVLCLTAANTIAVLSLLFRHGGML
jgi:predicted RNase H-like nuclease (RuvC/YqgF family)